MSLQKNLIGRFDFVAHGDEDTGDGKAQFDLIFALLSRSYRAALPVISDLGVPSAATQTENLPFAVALSFEERSGTNLMGKIEANLKALFRKLIDVAAHLPGPVGIGAAMIDALDDLLNKHPDTPEAVELKKLSTDHRGSLELGNVSGLLQKWSGGSFAGFDLNQLTPEAWHGFLTKLHEKTNVPAAPAADGAAGGAVAGGGAVVVVPPVAPPEPPVTPPDPKNSPYVFTQLMGWLTSTQSEPDDDGEPGAIEYGFDIEGVCRFSDNAVQYGTWARLDVFGPDGSQLLTRRIDAKMLARWLYGAGADDLIVDIAPTRELRAALANPPTTRRDIVTVTGRLWFSDGRPFGARTIAIYAKPALARLIDDCCPPEEFEFKGCCGEIEESVPIIEIPQALAMTQTDQAGYFEFTYASDRALSRYALVQVSGLAMPLALELIAGKGETPSWAFAKPVLLQVESALILPDRGAGKIKWVEDDDESCGCKGLDFGEPNRALDEFKSDIIVRTTDPMIVRRHLRVENPGDETEKQEDDTARLAGYGDSPLDRNFRAVIGRDMPVEWDANPLLAQAVTISHGRILTIAQIWRSDGYSLGDLRYSLPLAPLQKKNIAVLDWDRSDRLNMESTQEYQEKLDNFVGRERDVSEIVNTALTEKSSGRSDSGGGSKSGGFGFSLGGLGFGGASGGSSSAWSSSSQNSSRELAGSFINKLRDQTVQAANAVRSQRVTMVQQVNQSESVRAVIETVANRNACHAITVQYFEVLRHFRVDHELSAVRECLYIPMPVTLFDAEKILRWRQSIETYLPSGYKPALEALAGRGVLAAPAIYANDPLIEIGGTIDLVLDFPLPPPKIDEKTTWDAYLPRVVPASPLPGLFDALKQLAEPDRAQYFETKIAPALARKYVASLKAVGVTPAGEVDLGLAISLSSAYRAGEVHRIILSDRGAVVARGIKRADLTAIRIKTDINLPLFDTVLAAGGRFSLVTEHLASKASASAVDEASLQTGKSLDFALPLTPEELADRKVADDALQARLIAHLNENVEFYHKAIWWTMDPDRRFTLLDGFIAPNAGGRSVASVVENSLVGIVGNSIVMPVAPGIRLDYFDETAAADGAPHDQDEDWLLARYRPLIPNPSTRIAVPTRGVFAESVMGSCNGCEKIDDSRNWQYWQHPLPDEPTAIEPLSLGSRAKDTPAVQPPAMPTSTFINQVTGAVPPAPDPIGLASAIAAMANGGSFRDMTGLAGTQQNSRDALTQSYATTTRFGELGAELSKKQIDAAVDAMKMVVSAYTGVPIPMGGGGDGSDGQSVGKSIAEAAGKGQITQQKAQELTADHLGAMVKKIGGGDSSSLPNVAEVRNAIKAAGDGGAPISVSQGDARVDIGAPTRSAPRAETGRPFWPLRSRGSASRDHDDTVRLPTLKIEVVTAIRDSGGAIEVGEKSRQAMLLDCGTPALHEFPMALGKTKIGPITLQPVRSNFRASLYDSANDIFRLLLSGQTASGVLVMPDIDYQLQISVDPRKRRVHITGSHDGFPSYSVLIDGKTVYDYEQNIFIEAPVELMGKSDVSVDRDVSF